MKRRQSGGIKLLVNHETEEATLVYKTDRPDRQPVTALDSLRLRRAEMKRRRKGAARMEQQARTAEGRRPIPLSSWNVVYDYSGSRYYGVRP